MNSKRFYFIMLIVTSVLGLGIIGAAYIGSGMLQKQANKLVSLKLDSKVADEQQTSLLQAKKDIAKYADLEKEAKAIVPQDKDQAQAVREIVRIADASNVKLSNISFPSSTLGQGAVLTAPGAKTPTTSKSKTPPLTQVQAVSGIPGLYSMEINIQSNSNVPVTYGSFINFLSRLEQNRRTAQVTGVTIIPDVKNSNNLSFTLVINVYIKP